MQRSAIFTQNELGARSHQKYTGCKKSYSLCLQQKDKSIYGEENTLLDIWTAVTMYYNDGKPSEGNFFVLRGIGLLCTHW